MTVRTRTATALLLAASVVGCSSYTENKRAEPVAVKGTVTLPDGKPAKDAILNLIPTEQAQLPASATLKADGTFTMEKVFPGKYSFAFEGKPNVMKSIPTKYHSPDSANMVEISDRNPTVTINLTN